MHFIKSIFISCSILLGFLDNLFAQQSNSSLKGRVVFNDKSNMYVSINLKKQKRKTIVTTNDEFLIKHISEGSDSLIISFDGIEIHALPVYIQPNTIIDLGEISIQNILVNLPEVAINARIAHFNKNDSSISAAKNNSPLVDLPLTISNISSDKIKERMDFNVKEAIEGAAGINQYSGYDEYTIRGFKAENARLINGLRGYSTSYTSNMLSNVERIEILKGPVAILYGNGDPGGTVNLVTKKPRESSMGEFSIGGGSWNHFRAQADITGALSSNKKWLGRFNAAYDQTNSFRSLLFAKSYQIAPSFLWNANKRLQISADFSLSHINTLLDRGQPGLENDFNLKSTSNQLIASLPGDFLREAVISSNILLNYKINDHIHFNSGYLNYYTQQDHHGHGIRNFLTSDSVNLYHSRWDYQTMTHSISNYVTFNFKTSKIHHKLITGYDFVASEVFLNQKFDELQNTYGSGSGIVGTFSLLNPAYITPNISQYQESTYNLDPANVDGVQFSSHGFYIQDQISFKNWRFLLGLRQELYSSGDADEADDSLDIFSTNLLIPRLGIVYKLKPTLSLFASYSGGFDPFEASSRTQIFKDPFKPITSKVIEAGLKYNLINNRLSATLSLYQLSINNVAVNANDITRPNLFVQRGLNRSKGIETELNGNILPNLSVSVSFAYCDARITKSSNAYEIGKRVENAPLNSSNSWIKYYFSKGIFRGFSLVAGHTHVSSRNTLEEKLILPGYTVINGGVRYEKNKIKIALNVNNIGNITYWKSAYNNTNKWPGAPRNMMINIAHQF